MIISVLGDLRDEQAAPFNTLDQGLKLNSISLPWKNGSGWSFLSGQQVARAQMSVHLLAG